jgi:hypothetical protein
MQHAPFSMVRQWTLEDLRFASICRHDSCCEVSVAAASFDCGGFALDPDVSFRAVTALMRGYINSRTCGREFISRDMSPLSVVASRRVICFSITPWRPQSTKARATCNLIFLRVTLLPLVRGGMDTGRVFAFAL